MSDPDDGAWLLELETRSRRQGSGITRQQLAGHWRLVELWNREARPQPAPARLLQALQASLEIQPAGSEEGGEAAGLQLRTACGWEHWSWPFRGPGGWRAAGPCCAFASRGCSSTSVPGASGSGACRQLIREVGPFSP